MTDGPVASIITLGSCEGDRFELLGQAIAKVLKLVSLVALSDVYETFHQHDSRLPPYLNTVACVEGRLDSSELLSHLKEIESKLREGRNHMDLDLIDHGGEIIRTPTLTLPHPEAHRRAFVMIPLSQIQPEWHHPILRKSSKELAQKSYWPEWGRFAYPKKALLDSV